MTRTIVAIRVTLLAGALAIATAASAGNFYKANNSDALDVPASWTNNAVPGALDTAIWDANAGIGTNSALGTNQLWGGLEILNPGGPVSIAADGNTLTLTNPIAVDMLQADDSLTLSNNVTVADPQVWAIGNNQTLNVPGLLTNNYGAEVLFHFDNSAAQVIITPNSATGSMATGDNAMLAVGNVMTGTSNDVDFAALSANGQVVGGASLGIYTPNPATGSTPNLAAGPTTVYDFNSPNDTDGYNGCRISTTTYIDGMRFNTPQTNTAYLYEGVPAWLVTFKSGNVLDPSTILLTTNLGNCPVVFGPGGDIRMYNDASANAINELVVIQNNPAANLIFQSPVYERTAGIKGIVSKMGAGTLEFQATAGNSGAGWTGGTLIYGGTVLIDGPGTIGSAPVQVYAGGNFEGAGGATNLGPVMVASGGTNSVSIVSANGQFINKTNLTFNQGTTWMQFIYSNTLSPSATVAPLLITNGALSASNTVNLNIICGDLAVGQYPLIQYTSAFPLNLGSNTFAGVFNVSGIEPHVMASLVNDTASNSIDLLVTSVNQPIHWAVGSGTWDIGVSANWEDAQGTPTTYQQLGTVGDNVVLSDAASGPSPIAIALNTVVYPSSVSDTSSADNYSISGTGSLNGAGALTKSGSGALTLSVANTLSGGLALDGGTLNFASLNNLGSGPVTFNGGTLQYATGNTADISGLKTIFSSAATIDTGSNNVSYANPIGSGDAGGLTKAGSGTLTLSGTNTYSGTTVVGAGTLALAANAELSETPTIIVSNGATFDTSGLLDGAVTNFILGATINQTLEGTGTVKGEIITGNGATISPAGSGVYGTLAVDGSLVLSAGTEAMDVSAASSDLITVSSNLTLTGGILQLNVSGTMAPGTYPLITYGGALLSGAGSSANLTVAGFSQPGAVASLSDATAHQINLVVQAANNFVEVWAGNDSSAWDIGVTANWLIGPTPSDFENGDITVFNDTSGNANISIMAAVQPGDVEVASTNNNYSFGDGTGDGGGRISGTAGLVKTGPSILFVNTLDNNSGGTSIGAGGTVQVGNGAASGDLGPGNITNNGTLIYDQPDSRSVPGVISGSGTLTQEGVGTLTLTNNNTYSGGTTIANGVLQIGAGGSKGAIGTGPITNNTSLIFAPGGSLALTVASGISGGGTVTLTNAGTLTLAGSNSYTGTTYVEGGDLKTGSATAIPVGVVELDGQNGPAGLFDLNGFNVTLTGLAGTAGATNGTVANNSGTAINTLTINTLAGSTYSGQIADSTTQLGTGKIAVFITGGGSQTFDVESATGNTYSGGTIISNATLTLSSVNEGNLGANSVGLGSGTVTLLNGTLDLAGSGSQDNGATWAPGLANTVIVPTNWTGTVAGAQRGQAFNPVLQGGGVFTYLTEYVRGDIGGNWSGFTGQVYWLGTSSGSGQMGIGTSNSFYKVFCTNYIVFYNILANTPTISFGELADDGTTTIESTTSGNAGGAAAIFSAGGANTSATFGGSIIDNVGIAKVGTGVWGLTNGPTSVVTGYTYTGPTIVSNGILAFSNLTPTASTPITIAAPGILDVTGAGGLTVGSSVAQTIQGNGKLSGSLVVQSLGTVLPGATSIGTLTVTGSAELGGAITMKLNTVNGAQSNDVLASSSLLVDSTATLIVTNMGPTLDTGDTFRLFQAGSISGPGFASVSLPATDSTGTVQYTWDTTNLMTTGTITLTQGGTPSSINFTPSNLVYSVSSGLLDISWPANQTGWYLEAQTNPPNVGITTNWAIVPGSSSTNSMAFQISPTNTVFYRLFYTTNTPP